MGVGREMDVFSFGEVLMDCLPDKNVIGGAPFNVITHLNRLGVNSAIISKIGEDQLGNEILSFLKKEGTGDFVQIDKSYPTGNVTVKFVQNQPQYTIHSGCGWEKIDFNEVVAPKYFVYGSLALYFEQNKASFLAYKKAFNNTIFLCDINLRAPFYNADNIELCLSTADILKINDEELEYLAAEAKVEDGILWLKEQYKITKIILTKGSKGATLFWEGRQVEVDVAKVSDFKDTVGAGDSFTALFIHGLINELPFEENLNKASEFAAMICENEGAIPSNKDIYSPFLVAK